MNAVTYSRYSSDNQRETSIEDQGRNCRRFCEREGLSIVGTYADKAMSGSRNDRPDYQRMMADAEARKFDVLIVDDPSRLSRDDIETKTAIRRLQFWGVRIVGVSDGFDSTAKGSKLHAGLRSLINESYLDELRDKTHRGQEGQARKGLNTGGRAYSYRNVAIEDSTRKDEYGRPVILGADRVVEPEEAKWVRQIFGWYAEGLAPKAIADRLNRAGVKSPRGKSWAGSTIYGHPTKHEVGILNNPTYLGRVCWNRSMWVRDPDTGRRKRVPRPEHEWVIVDRPDLRIIDDELWERVKARQRDQHAKSKAIRRALHEKARTGAGPKFLFSSLLKCGACGANYAICNGSGYGCSTNINRGDAACPNRVRVSRRVVETVLLDAIKADLFTDEGIELFKREVRRLLAERRTSRTAATEQARRDIERIEREIANIVTAIKAGILTPTTKAELEKAEAERAHLECALKLDTSPLDDIDGLLASLAGRYREMVDNLETVTLREVTEARNCIKALVGGDIKLVPTDTGGLNAEVRGDYAGLLELVKIGPGAMVAGAQLTLVAGARNHLKLLFQAVA